MMSQLLGLMRDRIRTLHDSIRTEDAYLLCAKQFILFPKKRHPLERGEAEVGEFLTYLAVERNVAASTQNQALSAILFLDKIVLERPLKRGDNVLRAKKPSDCRRVAGGSAATRLDPSHPGTNRTGQPEGQETATSTSRTSAPRSWSFRAARYSWMAS